jgi:hypothetical protein
MDDEYPRIEMTVQGYQISAIRYQEAREEGRVGAKWEVKEVKEMKEVEEKTKEEDKDNAEAQRTRRSAEGREEQNRGTRGTRHTVAGQEIGVSRGTQEHSQE